MTRKVMDGRIWQSGETFLLELKNGSLVQKLGTFYQQKTYKDLENMNIQNVTDNVITADGVQRPLITINGVFPGPTLEVMEGSEVSIFLGRCCFGLETTVIIKIESHPFYL